MLPSSSSIALSSMESELVDMLLRRMLKDGGWLEADADNPTVVTESRRLCASLVAGKPPLVAELPRLNNCERATCEIEPRLFRGLVSGPALSDMFVRRDGVVLVW